MSVQSQAAGRRDPADEEIDKIGIQLLFSGARADCFKLKAETPVCDIVMKGGVTSGVVYPYAVLRLAQDFRLSGIGGTSAGAMAAALTAAAEYARKGNGDHLGFARLEKHCAQLPEILSRLFQPHASHRPVFELLMACLEAADSGQSLVNRLKAVLRLFTSRAGVITGIVVAAAFFGGGLALLPEILSPKEVHGLWFGAEAGAFGVFSGVLLLSLFLVAVKRTSRWPMVFYLAFMAFIELDALGYVTGAPGLAALAPFAPAALGGALGMVAGVVFVADMLIGRLRRTDFGLCPGLQQAGCATPGVTDWLHQAIQDVAGRSDGAPLTFGDIEAVACGPDEPRLALRMITTNLSLRRPYALPEIGGSLGRLGWKPSEWRKLFPEDVIDYLKLASADGAAQDEDTVRPLPNGSKLPVIVGARMSLSFPVLFSAVPVHELSLKGSAGARMLLVDGGLSSNLPLHFFDNLGPPGHPTFALNLRDTGRRQKTPHAEEVTLPRPGARPPRLPAQATKSFGQYLGGLLDAAKDWQDGMLSVMPGQFERIVSIRLSSDEGGLNLAMPPQRSRRLMQLGYRAGAKLAEDFDLQAHRVRRALVAYREIERVARAFERTWTKGGMAQALAAATAPVGARRAWRRAGDEIIRRLGVVAIWAAEFGVPVYDKYFPHPRGSLRITPNLSGDAWNDDGHE